MQLTLRQQSMVLANIRLVYKIVNKYTNAICRNYYYSNKEAKSQISTDLLDAGMIGLCRAATNFDESLGNSFATFAWACIRNEIIQASRVCEIWDKPPRDHNKKKVKLLSEIGIDADRYHDSQPFDVVDVDNEKNELWEINNNLLDEIEKIINNQRGTRLFLQHIYENKTNVALAKQEGITPERIRQILARATKKLQASRLFQRLLLASLNARRDEYSVNEFTKMNIGVKHV